MIVDEHLPAWATLTEYEWPTLLLGNGLSINLWQGFRYGSLFTEAELDSIAREVFLDLETTNFEAALECIHHSRVVLHALGQQTDDVDRLYAHVRDSLFETVARTHVPWDRFPSATHTLIAEALNGFDSVFTTNYDLSLYWSHLENRDLVELVDFMWNPGATFDPHNVDVRSRGATPIYYLHGAVHLWQDEAGNNGKWTSAEGGNLLNLAAKYPPTSGRRPLFISEGTSKAKARSIQRSAYLAFCRDALTDDDSNTVVFGHSLSEPDLHIIEALDRGRPRMIAVSLYPSDDPGEVVEDKVRIARALTRHRVLFFDSTTHPLGSPSLQITERGHADRVVDKTGDVER